jgi:hypothetical protein
MTVNYAAMAINEGFDAAKPWEFNWDEAKYHPTYAHWRDAQMGQHMEGYNGTAIVPDGALNVASHPPPNVRMEVYNRRNIMEVVGTTSGTSALHAAVRMGYSPIFLLGYDYYETKDGKYGYGNERCNWNDPDIKMEKFPEGSKWKVYESSLSSFRTLRTQMIDPAGVEVYNCNADSMLAEFPHMSLEDALDYVC